MELSAKAAELGIQSEFYDGNGQFRVTDPAALAVILDAIPCKPPQPFLGHAVVTRAGRDGGQQLAANAPCRCNGKLTRAIG